MGKIKTFLRPAVLIALLIALLVPAIPAVAAIYLTTSKESIGLGAYPSGVAANNNLLVGNGTSWASGTDLPTATTIGTKYVYRVDGTDVAMLDGGLNASLTAAAGGIFYSTSAAGAISAVGSSGQIIRSGGTGAPTWSTATYPATATATGSLLRSDGTNFTVSAATMSNSTVANEILYSSATNNIVGLATGNSGVLVTSGAGVPSIATDIPTAVTIGTAYIYRAGGTDVALADGGLNASLTASNGGIFYSTGTAGAILAGTATAGQMLRSGLSTAPTWSTATFPATATATGSLLRADGTNWASSTATFSATTVANELLYSSATNNVIGLPTANSSVLVTSGAGVPSLATDIPTAVTIGGQYVYRVSGTDVSLLDGGTNASLTASNGGIVYSGLSALAISAVGASGQILRSAGASAPTWSTATYPATATATGSFLMGDGTNIIASTATMSTTTTANQLLYSSAANNIIGLATANSGVLVTSGAGVPSIATDIPTAVTIGGTYIYRAAGTDVPVADGGTGLSSGTSGGVPYFSSSTTIASSAALTANRFVMGGGAGAAPVSLGTAAGGIIVTDSSGTPSTLGSSANGQVPIANVAGSVAWATITGTSNQVNVTNGASTITLATPQDIADTSNVVFNSVRAATMRGGTTAAGNLTLQSTSGVGTTDYIAFQTGSQSERARFLTGGALLINGTAAYAANGELLEINDVSPGIASFNGWSSVAANGPFISIKRSKSGAVGTLTAVANGDSLGSFNWQGMDATPGTFQSGAKIEAFVDGAPGASDMPTRLALYTTPDAAATPVERIRIDRRGVITTLAADPANVTAAGAGIFSGGIAMTDVANAWIDDASQGTGTVTHYIGNNTINVTAPSDERIKKNIVPAKENASEILNQIKMVDYRWKNPAMGTEPQFGWTAQQVRTVLPQIVETPSDSPWHVKAHKLMPYVVKAHQEQSAETAALKSQVAALEARLAALEKPKPSPRPTRTPKPRTGWLWPKAS